MTISTSKDVLLVGVMLFSSMHMVILLSRLKRRSHHLGSMSRLCPATFPE